MRGPVGQERGGELAEQFVRGQVPLVEFWRAVDAGDGVPSRQVVGTSLVTSDDVQRAIEKKLNGAISLSQLTAWAGTLASFSCFLVPSRGVKAALTRLALAELTDEGLRSLKARLQGG